MRRTEEEHKVRKKRERNKRYTKHISNNNMKYNRYGHKIHGVFPRSKACSEGKHS